MQEVLTLNKLNFSSEELKSKLRVNLDIIILPIAFLVVVILMSVSTNFKFLSSTNIGTMLLQMPELGLFSLAMMLAMTVGGIDLSIISTANFSSVVMAFLMTNLITETVGSGASLIMIAGIIVLGLAISAFLGMVNGILIAYVGVSPVLTTLSNMILFEGLTLGITKGRPISGLPEMFTKITSAGLFYIPISFIVFIVIAMLLRTKVKYSPIGKYMVFLGSNKDALEYSGIDVKKVIMKTYMLSGLLAGVAAVIMTSRVNAANARFGTSYLLLAVLISVLGGTDPDGGYVRVGGVIVALFTMQSINSGINILGISPFISTALWGILLVLTMFYRMYASQKKDKWLSDMAKNKQ